MSTETIQLGELTIQVERKAVKHTRLSVAPPDGLVTLVTPVSTRPEVARAFAVSKLAWIRKQQAALREQAREEEPELVTRESHSLWGNRYLLRVVKRDARPRVELSGKHIVLQVRPGTGREARTQVMHEWHKELLHAEIPKLIRKWEPRLGVQVEFYFLRRMKTKWGSCNHAARTIRLNTELVKKPLRLLEYVVVHEMVHLLEPTHNERFVSLLDTHYPGWREARAELNALPLGAERWGE